MPHVKLNNKPLTPAPKELTEDEKKIQAARAWLQKRNAVAEMILSQLCHGAVRRIESKDEGRELVQLAFDMADAYMEVHLDFPEAPKATE